VHYVPNVLVLKLMYVPASLGSLNIHYILLRKKPYKVVAFLRTYLQRSTTEGHVGRFSGVSHESASCGSTLVRLRIFQVSPHELKPKAPSCVYSAATAAASFLLHASSYFIAKTQFAGAICSFSTRSS
jgi:hypothetical protein